MIGRIDARRPPMEAKPRVGGGRRARGASAHVDPLPNDCIESASCTGQRARDGWWRGLHSGQGRLGTLRLSGHRFWRQEPACRQGVRLGSDVRALAGEREAQGSAASTSGVLAVSGAGRGGCATSPAFARVVVAAAAALAASLAGAADSPAERWKAAVEAMRKATGQTATPGAGPAPPSEAPGSASAPASGGLAPADAGKADIQGLRLGMTLDEARTVFKTSAARKVVREYRTTLVFTDANHREQPVPGGQYVSCINAHNADPPPTQAQMATHESDALLVCFVLTRAGERVAYVRRHVLHGQTRVNVQGFVDAVKHKYGTPTVQDGVPAGSGFSAVWRFGPPLPTPGDTRVDPNHANPKRAAQCWNQYSGGSLEWTPQTAASPLRNFQNADGLPWHCGAAMLRIDWSRGNRYPVDLSEFLLEYASTLVSMQLLADGIRHTSQLTQAAQRASVGAARGNAVTVNPSKL
ncbi:MAG TPA: hypothetical protein VI032_13340 [Burkholderiaceae bacterium]